VKGGKGPGKGAVENGEREAKAQTISPPGMPICKIFQHLSTF
jgi:hypothetical protein